MQFYKATFRYCSTSKSIVQGGFLCRSSKSFCCVNSSGNRTVKLLVGVDWRDSLTGVLNQWQEAVGVCGQAVGSHELPLIEFNDLAAAFMEEQGPNKALINRIHELGLEAIPFLAECNGISTSATECKESIRTLKSYCKKSLLPLLGEELDRIFQPNAPKGFVGHPVHYAFTESFDTEDQMDILLTSLRMVGRLRSNQLVTLDIYNCRFKDDTMEKIYQLQQGSTILLKLKEIPELQKEYDTDWRDNLCTVVRLAQQYRNSVLTLISAPKKLQREMLALMHAMHCMSFVHLLDVSVDKTVAGSYLQELNRQQPIGRKAVPAQVLPVDKSSFTREDVRGAFAQWQKKVLCTDIYPAYQITAQAQRALAGNEQKADQTDPMDELNQLIGLENAKYVIRQAIDFSRAQKLYEKRGFPTAKPGMHMVFTGAPGTAKTTVARLVGRICKKYGLLPTGEFLEAGRSDLVGQYVGHTAKCVAEAFQKAKGGVLFIDEAYSLLDDQRGLFGDEAINAIVQQMENVRNNTVVIFAGYPQEMEKFLRRNEELRSRISFHVDFPNYSEDELFQIFVSLIAKQKRELGPSVETLVRSLLRNSMDEKGFGNGRFVRSLAEKALMSQASRLMQLPEDKITDKQIRLLLPDDFEAPVEPVKKLSPQPIGFIC